MAHLRPKISANKKSKKKKTDVLPRDEHVEHVQNCRDYPSKSAWTVGPLCVNTSNIRYFLQITWFQCMIQFFRLILLNVEHRQV